MNGLNVEYFKVDVMEKIGNLIGNTMKVDPHTMSQARVDTVVVKNMGVATRVTANGLNVDHPARTDADNLAKKHGE
ncbi:hypothetical protein L3X38_041367 [Prunus dulcis]|uniref:Uncharacterized protein n=1 Tax=Prunus dulcis TaxID=3755 RepID=A0AAD4USX9_PRUDU|nr:hypothetical protein L3X38_041367 [Prunus dulcis]